MIISHTLKLIYIHIPKTSGTKMCDCISNISFDCENINEFELDIKNKTTIARTHLYNTIIKRYIPTKYFDTYNKITIVRNPYNRVYSAWNFFIKENMDYNDINKFIKDNLSYNYIFGMDKYFDLSKILFRPQYVFIYDNNGKKYVDYILKYEQLNNEISRLNNMLNIKIPLYANKNTETNYIEFFNNESIEIINTLYEKDFQYFNYKMIKL